MHSARAQEQIALIDRLLNDRPDHAAQVSCLEQLDIDLIEAPAIIHAVRILRERMVRVDAGKAGLVDIVGTGGDKSGSFNVSTTAAFVVAGAGYPVAKHGNVSITSKSGSIDLLRALGVSIPETPVAALEQLNQAGIMFLFAPYYHPTFKMLAEARRELAGRGKRTVFNLLGPLLNPASVKRAAVGVFDPRFLSPMAEALADGGAEKVLVFHGDGMDELSLTGKNAICEVRDGKMSAHVWEASDFGLAPCISADIAGGTPEENAVMTKEILRGGLTGAKKSMVILNAGAAIYAAEKSLDFSMLDAIARARDSLESGSALRILERLLA